MRLFSHLIISCSFLRSIYYGNELWDINYLMELEENFCYNFIGDIYFEHPNNHIFFVKFNLGEQEHILQYDLEKYKSKYNLIIDKIDGRVNCYNLL
jgi:hypothetical protein